MYDPNNRHRSEKNIQKLLWSNCVVHDKRCHARILVTFYPSSHLGLLTEFLWLESFQLQRSFLLTKCFILATSSKKLLRGKDYGYKIQIAYMVNFDLKHTHNFSRWLPFNYLSCVSTANFFTDILRVSEMCQCGAEMHLVCTLPVVDPGVGVRVSCIKRWPLIVGRPHVSWFLLSAYVAAECTTGSFLARIKVNIYWQFTVRHIACYYNNR